jgi:4-hydroxy-3-polyprenylbenzoate decarboxylase
MSHPYVLAITGASGAVYATRLLEVLIHTGHDVHLTISEAGAQVLKHELDIAIDLDDFNESSLRLDDVKAVSDSRLDITRRMAGMSSEESNVLSVSTGEPGQLTYHHYSNLFSPIASGSFLTSGMIICPCSQGTLSGLVHGMSKDLTGRAADVHLKERRPLILVPRETPLSTLHLENMHRGSQLGATILPAMPGWYHGVKTVQDLVDFVVGRILDQLAIPHSLMERWGEGGEVTDA